MVIYSIDTNALIDLIRRRYNQRVFPTLINKCEELIANGRLVSPDEVKHELERKAGDAVHAWAVAQKGLFVPTDEAIQQGAMDILGVYSNLVQADATETEADPYVIALAQQLEEGVVVTSEGRSNDLQHPKIPDVCSALGIACYDLLGFFENAGWAF